MYAATNIRFDYIALLAGVATAVVLLLTWQVDGGTRVPAAKVKLVTASAGELDVAPAGVTAEGAAIRAGGAALNRVLTVKNATAAPRDVRFAGTPTNGELNEAIHVSVRAEGRSVFSGTLDGFRHGSEPLRLDAGEGAKVEIRMLIPAEAPVDTWRARTVSVQLDLTSTEAR
jgi:hypothetical protein